MFEFLVLFLFKLNLTAPKKLNKEHFGTASVFTEEVSMQGNKIGQSPPLLLEVNFSIGENAFKSRSVSLFQKVN